MKKISLVMIFILISAFALHADVIEDEVFRLINLERSKVSLPPLPNNQRLHSLALYHSDNMAKNKFFSNTDLEGLDSKGRQLKLYPEMVGNITESFTKLDVIPLTDKNAAASIVKNLMNTPDYKKVILSKDFNAMGVGASKRGVGVYTTVTLANIIAESVNFKSEVKYGDDITVQYRILNKAPFTDFKIAVEMADPKAQIVGDDGKTYIGKVIYDVTDAGNTVISKTFKAEYGKGEYKVSLLYKGEHFSSNTRVITVK
ncbi:CAP domain-containing protein [Brachyspira pilosicoli]|uniref:CAP domain-containing protein n=2 Tax=Brachyspira pilosicoli TaxID=52584 RepID=A0AAJ6KDR4_BRAPL|nr:CAP domain-containing protein [Brachyspira pilosicoli]AFR70736.1 allergen V5/Tpx-1-like protein [Brachyspira pilosicoli B2904]WIH90827.1 CAP domain-containing protein [Brachyspira pilosicoli]WIH93118.1 CAP domain-containing protein [Brachyspira pilosicoli]WIH95407.1 CAP domain-containing protein [Brachyspira pilosicoli]